MSIAMGTRLHINLYIYIYKTTSVPILVLLSQNAQSDEKVTLSRCTTTEGMAAEVSLKEMVEMTSIRRRRRRLRYKSACLRKKL